MYKLYYSPGSCSLIIDTLLEELGVEFEMLRVDTGAGEHRKPRTPAASWSHGSAPRKRRSRLPTGRANR